MKPTTDFQKGIAAMPNRIDEQFILSKGFRVTNKWPLLIQFEHETNTRLFVTIGMYGELFIGEKHWINNEFDRQFSTTNYELNQTDFDIIVAYLGIKL